MYDVLVVGAGFAGSVMAERLAGSGRRVLVVDRREHVAGNAYDERDAAGVLIHRYGPHVFHTNSEKVFRYLSRFTDWREYEHRVLADVGDVTRFADRNRFASWTGTAPLDASSGEQNRHRLSRAGNRRMNHMIHIAAISQIRLDTEGRAYYRRKLASGKTKLEALRCLIG